MKYEVNFCGVRNVRQMHEAIKAGLNLPDYYGMNLDALWDCLTEMETPCEIGLMTDDGADEVLNGRIRAAAELMEEAAQWHAAHGRDMKVFWLKEM